MSDEREQFLLKPKGTLRADLDAQREALGFYSANELALVYLTALSKVPPDRVFEALAGIRKYNTKKNM